MSDNLGAESGRESLVSRGHVVTAREFASCIDAPPDRPNERVEAFRDAVHVVGLWNHDRIAGRETDAGREHAEAAARFFERWFTPESVTLPGWAPEDYLRIRADVLRAAAWNTSAVDRRDLLTTLNVWNCRLHAVRRLARAPSLGSEAADDAKPAKADPIAVAQPGGFMGGEALADALCVHPSRREAFFKQLERERMRLGDDVWLEVLNRQANTPRYQYKADAPQVRQLAQRYTAPKPG